MTRFYRVAGDARSLASGRPIIASTPNNLLEKIRQIEFPDKPTRMDALFAFENRDFALGWNRGFEEHVYVVDTVDQAITVHRGDIEWIDSMAACRTFEAVEACARNYWEGGAKVSGNGFEVVVPGRLRVKERISRIGDDSVLKPSHEP